MQNANRISTIAPNLLVTSQTCRKRQIKTKQKNVNCKEEERKPLRPNIFVSKEAFWDGLTMKKLHCKHAETGRYRHKREFQARGMQTRGKHIESMVCVCVCVCV